MMLRIDTNAQSDSVSSDRAEVIEAADSPSISPTGGAEIRRSRSRRLALRLDSTSAIIDLRPLRRGKVDEFDSAIPSRNEYVVVLTRPIFLESPTHGPAASRNRNRLPTTFWPGQ
jgi:hypothetical protein